MGSGMGVASVKQPVLVPEGMIIIINIPKQYTVMVISFQTDRCGQTVQTQIRLLLEEEQSDQGLHCLQFHLHLFDENTLRFGFFV